MGIASTPAQARTPFTGGLLRLARARRGLRQADLARELGVGRAMVSHVELGRRSPSPELLDRIVAFLEESRPEGRP